MQIDPISAFSDNYIWCLHDGRQAIVVDPGDAAPVEAHLAANGMTLSGVLITHHHFDHTGGLPDLCRDRPQMPVWGPSTSSPHINRPVTEGDTVECFGHDFRVIAVPGHTLDHIAFFSAGTASEPPVLLSGDTLFAAGCGRLFEGTPEQMVTSLGKLLACPDDTRIYCAHEYTEANLRFAIAVEPDNDHVSQRLAQVEATRAEGGITLPSTLAEEKRSNPFLRCQENSVQAAAKKRSTLRAGSYSEVFAAIRGWKDAF